MPPISEYCQPLSSAEYSSSLRDTRICSSVVATPTATFTKITSSAGSASDGAMAKTWPI